MKNRMRGVRPGQISAMSADIFGPWVGIVALLASKTKPLEGPARDRVISLTQAAYDDLATAENPSIASWRDIADALNFLQSTAELGWADDPDGVVDGTKTALAEAFDNFHRHGKLRLSATGLTGVQHCIQQLHNLVLGVLSAHSYWVAVRHTKLRVDQVARGAKQAGDTVVML